MERNQQQLDAFLENIAMYFDDIAKLPTWAKDVRDLIGKVKPKTPIEVAGCTKCGHPRCDGTCYDEGCETCGDPECEGECGPDPTCEICGQCDCDCYEFDNSGIDPDAQV
mgnify:CR=1 FL=1